MSTHARTIRVNRLEDATQAPAQAVDAISVMPKLTTATNNPEIQATLRKAPPTGFAYIVKGQLAGKPVAQEIGESCEDFTARLEALL